jgi:hypothetical protein
MKQPAISAANRRNDPFRSFSWPKKSRYDQLLAISVTSGKKNQGEMVKAHECPISKVREAKSTGGEGTIGNQVRLGDLLIRANLITEEDVQKALACQRECGGRLGDNLVAVGAISQKDLNAFVYKMPAGPPDIASTGLETSDLISLLMKLIYTERLETVRQFKNAIKLPYHLVIELVRLAVDNKLLRNLGAGRSDSPIDLGYAFTEEGRRFTLDALEQLRYAGPAPVTLDDFTHQVCLQRPTNELVTLESITAAIAGLVVSSDLLEQCGPALNSGRAILLYGAPGNGKSSVARRFASVYKDVIYVPYSVTVDGQIIRVHDPSIHFPVEPSGGDDEGEHTFVREEEVDERWVPCKRPFVITGGELTLDMLDLRYDTTGNYYEAPLHMKALGGCFMIDDFGRQLVSPTNLLNRWIVPLENRVDYLKLHTGKSFTIPFEELIIFSTNLEPEDLMDPAFLRRLPHKIEVGPPRIELYQRIFEMECERQGLELPGYVFDTIVTEIREKNGMDLAAYQPRFIVDQVVATCRFLGEPAHFEPRFIDYAVRNLGVRRGHCQEAHSAASHPAAGHPPATHPGESRPEPHAGPALVGRH